MVGSGSVGSGAQAASKTSTTLQARASSQLLLLVEFSIDDVAFFNLVAPCT